jgi:hypothetical protein
MDGAHWVTEAISLMNENLVSVNAGLDIEIKRNQVYMSPHINLAPIPNTEFKENRMANRT